MVEMDAYCMIIDSKMAFNCIFAVETLPSVPDVIQKLGLIWLKGFLAVLRPGNYHRSVILWATACDNADNLQSEQQEM